MLHPVRHHGGQSRQRLADRARVDEGTRFPDAGAEHRVGRRADAKPSRLGGSDDCDAVGDRGGQRLFGIDMLARLDRLERYLRVGLRNGEIQDNIDVVALQDVRHGSRVDHVAFGLPLRGVRIEIGAGGKDDVSKARCVLEIDVRNVAAPDKTYAHGRPHGHHCPNFA